MTSAGMMERAPGQDEVAAVAAMAAEQVRQSDVPIDGGYGYEIPVWDPAAAHEAWQRQQWHAARHDALRSSIEGMLGSHTVNDCRPAYFDYDKDSEVPPIVQYCDYLASEATRYAAIVEFNGGQSAVSEYAASLPPEQVDSQRGRPGEIGGSGGFAV